MVRLASSFAYEMRPVAPYDFDLTVHKPAGWSLFTPFEVYEKGTMWTATHLAGELVGLRLSSQGTVRRPKVSVRVFAESRPDPGLMGEMERSLGHNLGADEDLGGFYKLARKDRILRHAVDDLYGMHNTASVDVFPDAALTILLQMAPLKRSNEMMAAFITKYGRTAEFDGRRINVWPLPRDVARLAPARIARECKLGYRAKRMVQLAKKLSGEDFPTLEELERLSPEEAKGKLLELPGIGDYSADIINPHGGFPIDVWSADVFGKLFFGREPRDKRKAIDRIKAEGVRRWGGWSWMAFFYTVQDLENLSRELGISLRLS
jgi:3-methyladenine DNA glycosylase/8-oxoguanine DNA glycosylase